MPHLEAPVPWFLEADSMPGSAATNWVCTLWKSAAPSESNASVVSSESNAVILGVIVK